MKKTLTLVLLLIFLFLFLIMYLGKKPTYRLDVAELGQSPRWSALYEFKPSVDLPRFQEILERYYAIGDAWKEYFELESDALSVGGFTYKERKVLSEGERGARYWRAKSEMPPRSAEKPLSGVRVALDPGHIGGKCAKLEERWFQIGDNLPVMEGEMTLLVAQLIKPRLESLGAEVYLTREENAPVGVQRSPHFMALAKAKVEALELNKSMVNSYADKFFYRTAEIRARARKVNEDIKPDLVVALHFNAEAWGDPADPQLTERNHFHILLNGAYTSGELAHEDERFELTRRILQGTILEEIPLSQSFVQAFVEETGLPAYLYEKNSTRAIPVDEEGYVWTRNLLANRLYACPTIFLEPYVMNSHDVHARVQLGDYEGKKEVNGELRKSIFREYADAVVKSLQTYYED